MGLDNRWQATITVPEISFRLSDRERASGLGVGGGSFSRRDA
jgi:hypothetical protein